MVATFPLPPLNVEVVDGAVVIRDLVETDATLVALVDGADDPTECVLQCLRVGAQALRSVAATVDAHIVEKRFDAMSDHFDERVESVVEQISDTARGLLDEDEGALTQTLAAHRSEIESLLGATFDPESKQSVISAFERILVDAHREQADAVRKLVAIDGDDSPLAKLRLEVNRELRDQLKGVRDEVKELSEKIAVSGATATLYDRSTGKGFDFEDALHDAVGRIAAGHGDAADQTGNESGSDATKVGDEVVTLNPGDTFGREACFVFEAKRRKLNMRATMAELDGALTNRDSLAAVAVFASQDQAPTAVPFHPTDNKAIVVFDPESGDDSALRLAYMWARWIVRREINTADSERSELDLEKVQTLFSQATRGLEKNTQVKKFHTQARKGIDQAEAHAMSMVDDVRDAIDQIEALLS